MLDVPTELGDPLAIVEEFDNEHITEITEEYVEQETTGREGLSDNSHQTTDEYLDDVRETIWREVAVAGVPVTADGARPGVLSVMPEAIRGSEKFGYFVLREGDGGGAFRRYVKLRDKFELSIDGVIGVENIDHAENEGRPLQDLDVLYADSPDLTFAMIKGAWDAYERLGKVLRDAPLALEQARQTFLIAKVLTEAPLCKGEARDAAEELLKGALAYYRDARDAIAQGAVGPAYTKLRRVARYLALQEFAVELEA